MDIRVGPDSLPRRSLYLQRITVDIVLFYFVLQFIFREKYWNRNSGDSSRQRTAICSSYGRFYNIMISQSTCMNLA